MYFRKIADPAHAREKGRGERKEREECVMWSMNKERKRERMKRMNKNK